MRPHLPLQIPQILAHHESFLKELKIRLESWDSKQTIGDWFLESVSFFLHIIFFGEASINDVQFSCPATVRTDVMYGNPKIEKTPFVVVIPRWSTLQFSKKSVIDTYTAFIRNVKRADEAIRIARQTKPAFDRFLQVTD